MALKKPLVITNGQIQQLQAGDTIAAAPEVQTFTNDNAGTINIGFAVYVKSDGDVDLAQADAVATSVVAGLVFDTTIAAAAAGLVIVDGVLTATTTQWDAVTGETGGLTQGARYYLSEATPGELTITAPTADGDLVCPVGVALSDTKLKLNVERTVLL